MARKGKRGNNNNKAASTEKAEDQPEDQTTVETAPPAPAPAEMPSAVEAPAKETAEPEPAPTAKTTSEEPKPKSPAAPPAQPVACHADVVVAAPQGRVKSLSPTPRRAHPAALPANDSNQVTALRTKLRKAGTMEEQLALAQQITEARYPLAPKQQKQISMERDAAFVREYGGNQPLHKAVEHKVVEREKTPPPELPKKDDTPPPAPVAAAAVPPAAKEDAEVAQTTVSQKPEMTDEEAEEFQRNTIAELRSMLADIERMKERQDEWKSLLEAMFAQEADEDQRARRLFADVMTSEAFFLGDREFREWMAKHESKGEGVGGEGLLEWYHADALLSLTPYLAFVPCPRNLTPTGEKEFAAMVDRVLADARRHDESFRVLAYPVQPHHTSTTAASNVDANAELPLVRNGNDVIELVRDNVVVKQFLDVTKSVFFGAADLPATSTIVRAFVAAGELLGVEPYSTDDITLAEGAAATTDSAARAAISRALVQLFASGLRTTFGARTYCFIARLDAAAGEGELEARLLNVGPMDAREYSQFSWTDLVGLMATAKVTRRRLRLPTSGSTLVQPLNADVYDAEDAWRSVTVRGTIKFVKPAALLMQSHDSPTVAPSPPSSTVDTLAPPRAAPAPAQPPSHPAPLSAVPAVVAAPPATAAAPTAKPSGNSSSSLPGPLFWIGLGCVAFAAARVFKHSG